MASFNRTLAAQLGFLRLGGQAPRPSEDEERLLAVFQNRVALKQSFNRLQDEVRQLRDRLKQQEGMTAQAQEAMQTLERRLARTDSGFAALLHYQLRDLWEIARRQLERHLHELRQQREAVELAAFERDFRRRLEARVAECEAHVRELADVAASADGARQRVAEQLARERGWWKALRRRRLRKSLLRAGDRHQQAHDALVAAQEACERAAAEVAPRFPGLSLGVRRTINLVAVAYAELLRRRLEQQGLLDVVHTARLHDDGTMSPADRATCERLLPRVDQAREALLQQAGLQEDLRVVTQSLRPFVRYADEAGSVPEALALAAEANGSRVLLDNAWELSDLLL